MKLESTSNSVRLYDFDTQINSVLDVIAAECQDYFEHNLIIDLSQYRDFKTKDLDLFKQMALQLKNNKKSFVIILKNIDFNKTPNFINVVPTLQEAHDLIELEIIERDLGL